MINLKFHSSFFLNGAQQALALIHVHIGNARVQAESVVAGAQRPDVYVVDLLPCTPSTVKDGADDFFDARISRGRPASRMCEDSRRMPMLNCPEDEKADGDAEERVDPESTPLSFEWRRRRRGCRYLK